jgi:hypothetical protein
MNHWCHQIECAHSLQHASYANQIESCGDPGHNRGRHGPARTGDRATVQMQRCHGADSDGDRLSVARCRVGGSDARSDPRIRRRRPTRPGLASESESPAAAVLRSAEAAPPQWDVRVRVRVRRSAEAVAAAVKLRFGWVRATRSGWPRGPGGGGGGEAAATTSQAAAAAAPDGYPASIPCSGGGPAASLAPAAGAGRRRKQGQVRNWGEGRQPPALAGAG